MMLVDRVKAILMSPQTEWPIIAEEPTDIAGLYTSYILPLAAIGPVCGFLGSSLVGRFGYSFTARLELAIGGYISALVGVYVLGLIISKLAPYFGASENLTGGLKVAAYGSTAAWVGGVFRLIPLLGILGLIAGLYSLYLFYLGLPVVMRTPQSNALPYTALSIVGAIVVGVIAYAIEALLVPGPRFM